MPSRSADEAPAAVHRFAIRWGWSELLVGGAGVLSGGFAAGAYYTAPLRPLSHGFVIWIVLVSLVTARHPVRQAVVRATTALLAAVVAFYLGKEVMYGIKYAGAPYTIDLATLGTWCVLAVVAGVLLGMAFSHIGRSGWPGAAATAAAAGLVLADAYRLGSSTLWNRPLLLIVSSLAVVGLLLLGGRSQQQLGKAAVLVVPFTLIGYGIVSAPDLLEQVLL